MLTLRDRIFWRVRDRTTWIYGCAIAGAAGLGLAIAFYAGP